MPSQQEPSALDKYFTTDHGSAQGPAALEPDSTHMVDQVTSFRRMRARLWIRLGLSALVCLTATFWLYQRKDGLSYHLTGTPLPLHLGEVTELAPAAIPHNRYVCLQGVTEHRGLQQQAIFGPTLMRQELWLLRLVGSQGVFIETVADGGRFGFSQRVDVCGRAIDPTLDSAAAALLSRYHETFSAKQRAVARVVEVDMRPGLYRWLYMGWLGLWSALFGLHLLAWWQLWQLHHKPWRRLGQGTSRELL